MSILICLHMHNTVVLKHSCRFQLHLLCVVAVAVAVRINVEGCLIFSHKYCIYLKYILFVWPRVGLFHAL